MYVMSHQLEELSRSTEIPVSKFLEALDSSDVVIPTLRQTMEIYCNPGITEEKRNLATFKWLVGTVTSIDQLKSVYEDASREDESKRVVLLRMIEVFVRNQ